MRILAIVLLIVVGCSASADEWKKLPSLPAKYGFAGSFAGVTNGALLVAGGSNFPDRKLWDGGTKVWYDKIFVLERPDGEWIVVGKLPRALAYGVCVTYGDGVVCVGGSDRDRHYADAFRLEWRNRRLVTTKLPPAPQPTANSCGALVGDVLYMAGGLEKPDAKSTMMSVWQIDLAAAEPKWNEIEACPGRGRMLAVAAGLDGAFWIAGGTDLVAGADGKAERRYLNDAYRYEPAKGWKRIADLPHSIVAAPSPAPVGSAGFYLLGGDDGSQVAVAPDKHRGFATDVFRYDLKSDNWSECGKIPAPQVTTPCVFWNNSWVVPGGEVRPGVRSPEVWNWTPGKTE